MVGGKTGRYLQRVRSVVRCLFSLRSPEQEFEGNLLDDEMLKGWRCLSGLGGVWLTTGGLSLDEYRQHLLYGYGSKPKVPFQ